MTQMLIKSETLNEIANGIRTKTGKIEAMTPIEMARAINEPSSYAWKKYSIPPTFSNATSWSDIGSAIASDINGDIDLSTIWSIGDEKDVTLTTGETITLQIAGFNHDTYSDGVTAPVTLVMKDCLNTKAQMNSSGGTNAGGYPASVMKTYVETNIYDKLPSDLKTLVAPVKKKWYTTYNDVNSLTEGNYNVWLLSEMEVSGTNTHTIGTGEGSKYDIFTDNASRIKKINGKNDDWWLGSCSKNYSTNFALVSSGGGVGSSGAGSSNSVAVGLCIRGTTPLAPQKLQKTFLSYITSDSILSYPVDGQKGNYWYELVQSNVDWGEVTLTSNQTKITVNHNLGEVPKWAGIFPNEKVQNWAYSSYVTALGLIKNGEKWQQIRGASLYEESKAPILSNSSITFDQSYNFYPLTYYWFALGSSKSLLSLLSWQQIGDLVLKAEQGTVNLSDYFSIGEIKSVTLTTGETIELQIAGFNHDTFSDGVTAPITFVMKDCLNTKAQINSTNDNTGGYPASAMKTYVETNIYDKLPADLKALVAPVKKKWYTTYNDANSLTEDNYNVWLLSEMEVFGTNTYTIGTGEGSKYPIFIDDASRIKKANGTNSFWWLGSCDRNLSYGFVRVKDNGAVYYDAPTNSRGVCAGLCIRGNA